MGFQVFQLIDINVNRDNTTIRFNNNRPLCKRELIYTVCLCIYTTAVVCKQDYTTERITMKLGGRMWYWSEKNPLNTGEGSRDLFSFHIFLDFSEKNS